VHLREDRRHIQDDDVRRLAELVHVKLNLEMAATDAMVAFACEIRPQMAMLVPEGRLEITTEGGLDVAARSDQLRDTVSALTEAGMSVSAFIDADGSQVEAACECGFRVCELHTGPYAEAFWTRGRDAQAPAVQEELARLAAAGRLVHEAGMRLNAGHGLNYANVQPIAGLPGVRELHIGHAVVSRSIFVGIRAAVAEMKRLMREAAAGA
jgi:pyridoxine 5-phosphate synthase